jgi:hypothetical protein
MSLAKVFSACALFSSPLLRGATFYPAPPMETSRYYHASVRLQDGRVLVTGGDTGSGNMTSLTEAFDPETETWSSKTGMTTSRREHTATLLPSGKVLVTGGRSTLSTRLQSAEIYDPSANSWKLTGSMNYRRTEHTATLLPNGKVLVCGGLLDSELPGSYAELFDPATGLWKPTGGAHIVYYRNTATLLDTGKVLVVGGIDGFIEKASAELYDPVTQTWSTTGSLITGRYNHEAVRLSDGRVLIAAGYNDRDISTCEIYDPNTGNWTATGSTRSPRGLSKGVLLNNNMVLLIGGTAYEEEIYDPVKGMWLQTGQMGASGRRWHTATLLASGRVLVAGGANPVYTINSTEVYDSNFHIMVWAGSEHLPDGGQLVADFGPTPIGTNIEKTFKIINGGFVPLDLGPVTIDGNNPSEFSSTNPANTTLNPNESTEFVVTLLPVTSGMKSAEIHLSSNAVGDLSPYDIKIQGTGLSYTEDSDRDGLNDAAELRLSQLGFDWQQSQIDLVGAYYAGAGSAGLYTTEQVHALSLGTPLLQRSEATGRFTLKLDLKKSADLETFNDFPAPPGSIFRVSPDGDLDFEFSVDDDAAFFRIHVD